MRERGAIPRQPFGRRFEWTVLLFGRVWRGGIPCLVKFCAQKRRQLQFVQWDVCASDKREGGIISYIPVLDKLNQVRVTGFPYSNPA